MKVIYSNEPPYVDNGKSALFLAGCTTRSADVPSWRPEAIQILSDLKFSGTVLVPEPSNGQRFPDYDKQVEWEYMGLGRCSQIVIWVPRNMENMLGLTTNVEAGYWLAREHTKVIYGRPEGAPHTKYLDWLYLKTFWEFDENIPPIPNTLNKLLEYVMSKIYPKITNAE